MLNHDADDSDKHAHGGEHRLGVRRLADCERGHIYVDPETHEVVTATETVEDLPQLTIEHRLVPGLRWEDEARSGDWRI